MFRTLIFAAAAAVVLSGCATCEQLMQQDGEACKAYGYTPGTDAYAGCMQTRDVQREQARAVALQNLSNSLQQMNQNLQQQQQQQQLINSLNRPVMTHCNTFGSYTNCTTY